MRFLAPWLLACSLVSVGACTEPSSAPVQYANLDDSFSTLRDAFNAERGRVRLLFVVDSRCPMCLKGMADIDDALLAETHDPRLQTFVVHVPVIGGTESDIGPSMQLLHNPNVHHYWNASGRFGGHLSHAAGLTRGDEFVYAWDVWLLYGPDATWSGDDPPAPDLLMHQLPNLRDRPEFPRLDAERFAREVHARLARLPSVDAAGTTP